MAIFHNPATAGLDALPAKEAGEASQGGKAAAGDGKPPPLAGKPKADLAKAAPGSIVNTASLEGAFPSYHPYQHRLPRRPLTRTLTLTLTLSLTLS